MNFRKKRNAKRRRWLGNPDQRTGAAMVEFAIVANIMFVSILTCMEFARLNMVRNLAQDAAYYAARRAIVPGATEAEAIEEASTIMESLVSEGVTIDVSALDSDSNDITVTVTVDLDSVALFVPMFLPNAEIETAAHMQTERYDGFYEQ